MPVTVHRGALPESSHRIHAVVVRAVGSLVAWLGDPDRLTTMRSCAKPYQAQPLIESGAPEALGWDRRTLAVCCASHAGLDMHADAVRAGLATVGLTPDALRNCAGSPEQRLRHNCSGNHLAFLAHSVREGWELDDYRALGHPSQRAALEAVARMAGVAPDRLPTCVDGCGVVAFALPLRTMAAMFARFPIDLPDQYAAMRAHPEMVSGPGGFDTELMRTLPGCVSKGGAEALCCVGLVEQDLGVAVRVEDGAFRALYPAVTEVLRQVLSWADVPDDLVGFHEPEVRNSNHDPVGVIRADLALQVASGEEI
ncbi:MAG: asparaginase [Gaiellales bacterium]